VKLAYSCALDTYAMVRLWQAFSGNGLALARSDLETA
jgi:hypothetical protein